MKMHRIIQCFLFAALLLPSVARAQDAVAGPGNNAIGVMLGEPTGLSFKRWHGRHAWDLAVGVGPGVRVHGDYLLTLGELLGSGSSTALDLYVGIGPVIGVHTGWCGRLYDTGYSCGDGGVFGGGRVPIGLDWRLSIPIDLAIEAAPGVLVAKPGAFFLIDAAIYVRLLL